MTLITNTNNHGEDCGPAGLQMALQARQTSGFPIIGIGQNVNDAFRPYLTTINGEKIAIVAATQVIDSDLQSTWTATPTQAGLASAYDVNALVAEIEAVRPTVDTVIVYLHWGTELQNCPNALQEPLAQVLVKAGADIIVGTHAHVLLGGGFLGSAYVDYGLGNFAFYDNTPPEDASGSLVITATGRHIDNVTWRPAVIADDLPQPLSGTRRAVPSQVGSPLEAVPTRRRPQDRPSPPRRARPRQHRPPKWRNCPWTRGEPPRSTGLTYVSVAAEGRVAFGQAGWKVRSLSNDGRSTGVCS